MGSLRDSLPELNELLCFPFCFPVGKLWRKFLLSQTLRVGSCISTSWLCRYPGSFPAFGNLCHFHSSSCPYCSWLFAPCSWRPLLCELAKSTVLSFSKTSCKFTCAVDVRARHLGCAADTSSGVSSVLVCAHLCCCGWLLEAAPLKQRPISWCKARSVGACLLKCESRGSPVRVLGPTCEFIFKLPSALTTFQKNLELQP